VGPWTQPGDRRCVAEWQKKEEEEEDEDLPDLPELNHSSSSFTMPPISLSLERCSLHRKRKGPSGQDRKKGKGIKTIMRTRIISRSI